MAFSREVGHGGTVAGSRLIPIADQIFGVVGSAATIGGDEKYAYNGQ